MYICTLCMYVCMNPYVYKGKLIRFYLPRLFTSLLRHLCGFLYMIPGEQVTPPPYSPPSPTLHLPPPSLPPPGTPLAHIPEGVVDSICTHTYTCVRLHVGVCSCMRSHWPSQVRQRASGEAHLYLAMDCLIFSGHVSFGYSRLFRNAQIVPKHYVACVLSVGL